jgi:molybdopterin-guanine dinucleotide biosynthesis protein A
MLPVNGQPLIEHIIGQLDGHFDEIIIGANDIEKYSFLKRKVIPDIEKDKGPLMGIYSSLMGSSNDINFITACDIPEMNIKLIKNMINLSVDFDIVMPVKDGDKHEPLYSIYRKNVTKKAEQILQNNGRRIVELLNQSRVKFVEFDDRGWYQNLNLKDDYLNYVKKVVIRECYRNNEE